MKQISIFLCILVALIPVIKADSISCNSSSHCPEDAPCCSQYGECGTGAYCLGGCDIRYSYNISACMPMPVCKNKTTDFTSTDQLTKIDDYLGNSSDTDWVYTGYVDYHNDNLLIQMPNQTSGTVLSSTEYIWYGKITAIMKSSRTQGVVTAFILFSDVQDEIDYEFVGSDLMDTQTNYYALGVTDYTKSKNVTTSNSTFDDFHTYEFDWQEDQITWSVDGQVGRVLNKADTWNSSTNRYDYPQTPSRVQFSLWPGGGTSSAIGTIAWAGGAINWDSADIQDPGYFYAEIQSIDVQCYDPPSNATVEGSKAYIYTDISAGESDVKITDKDTILGSSQANGWDPDYGKKSHSSSSSSNSSSTSTSSNSNASGHSNSSDSSTTNQDSVPTGTGIGGQSNGNSNGDSSSDTTTTTATNTGFVQSSTKSGTTSSSSSNAGFVKSLEFSFLQTLIVAVWAFHL